MTGKLAQRHFPQLEQWAATSRLFLGFYLTEPGCWHSAWSVVNMVRLLAWASLVTLGSHTIHQLIDSENSFLLGIWVGSLAAAAILWSCFLLSGGSYSLCLSVWWLRTVRRRARCRRILRLSQWPCIPVSPRLLEFPDRVWVRLPPYDQFAATPWFAVWQEGGATPVTLYSALALAEELDRPMAPFLDEDPPPTASQRIAQMLASISPARPFPPVIGHGRCTDSVKCDIPQGV